MDDAPWWRTWRPAVAIVVVGIVAVAGFVVGSRSGDDTGTPTAVRWGDARVVASDTGDGVIAELLVASADDGGQCAALSLVEAGSTAFAEQVCGDPILPWTDDEFEIVRLDDYFGWFGEHAIARPGGGWAVAVGGAVHPDIARATLQLGDGTEYSFVTAGADGWFVALLPDEVADPDLTDGRLVNAPIALELFGADGSRLATATLTGAGP